MPDQPTPTHPPQGDPTPDAPANALQTLSEDGTHHTLLAPDSVPGLFGVASPSGYTLLAEVGRGGMGVVYRAHDTTLNRDVAVKVLQDRYPSSGPAARRFLEEAGITSQLQHPGIAPIHQVGTLPNGRPFLVMKLIKGNTLDQLLTERWDDVRDRGRFLPVFEQICLAVGYAHSIGVIHRDLKPSNVMVGKFGEVQVMDWGLAKVLAGRECEQPEDEPAAGTKIRSVRELGSRTVAGAVLGTPAFMPPEQAGGEVDRIDARSDVFALGGILCVILTGKPPYTGKDTNEIQLKAIRGQTAEALARLDACGAEPELVALAKLCIATDPVERPASATVVAASVAEFRSGAEARARQAELDRVQAQAELRASQLQATEQKKRRKVQLALAGAVALLVFVAGAFAWWQDRQATAAKAEEDRRKAQTEGEVTAALAEMATLCDRGEKEIENPPRWRLTLASARSAQRRAAAALEAGPASDELREQFRSATARLDRDGYDCETAEMYEPRAAGFFRVAMAPLVGSEVSRFQRQIDSVFDRVGLSLTTTSPKAFASAIRAHRLRYQLTLLLIMRDIADERRKTMKDENRGGMEDYVEEILREVHPLQHTILKSEDAWKVVTGEQGRSLTSAELLCLAFADMRTSRGISHQPMLLAEALKRNPADLIGLALRGFRGRTGEVIYAGGVQRIRFPDDVRPQPLNEERLQEIVAIANAVTIRPDLAVLRSWAGEQLEESGLHAAAYDRYDEALKLEPGLDDVRARMAEVLLKVGALKAAVDAYREAVSRSPRIRLGATPFVNDDERCSLRVRAARAAILLASGVNPPGEQVAADQKPILRREALSWLRDWLDGQPTGRELFLAKRDPAYAAVRHPFRLALLPPAEAKRWRDLWGEIRSTRDPENRRYGLEGDNNQSALPHPNWTRDVAPPAREVKR